MLKKIMLIFFGVIFFIPINVSAAGGKVLLNCDKNTISSDESVKCSITGDFDYLISAFHGVVVVSDKLVLSELNVDSSWEGSADKGTIDLYTDKNKMGKVNFITFTLKPKSTDISGDISVVIDDIFVGNKNFEEVEIVDASFKLKVTNTSTNDNINDDNNINNNDNSNDNNNSDNNQNVTTNPQTGNNSVIYISILLGLSVVLIILQNKTEKDSN